MIPKLTYTAAMYRGGPGLGKARWAVLCMPSATWAFAPMTGRGPAMRLAERLTEDEAAGDFRVGHLPAEHQSVARAIRKALGDVMGRKASGCGCTAFRTIQDHARLGHLDGVTAEFILVHDGGDLAHACNPSYHDYEMQSALRGCVDAHGYYTERLTSVFTAVYRKVVADG